MPPKRRGFYDEAPADTGLDLLRERNVETLIQPLIQPQRTVQRDVPVDRIRPNPFQARRSFGSIEELAQSMRVQGFVSRLRVRPDPADAGYFQLVYGERRWRAAQIAGLTTVPCEIAEHTDAELIEIGLLENIQREDLDPLEEAQAFRTFIEQRGYTVRSLAERIGKSKGYVDNRLALLRAPEDVQRMVEARPDTIASARLIAQLPTPEERQPLITGLANGSLAAKDVRELLRDGSIGQSTGEGDSGPATPSSPIRHRSGDGRNDAAAQSERDLARAMHMLETVMEQLEAMALEQAQRNRLLDYVVTTHFPRLEHYVEALQERRSRRGE